MRATWASFVRAALLSGLLSVGCIRVIHERSTGTGSDDSLVQTSPGSTEQIAGLAVSVWRPAGPLEGARPAPLVLFSHGYHGSSTQSSFLMTSLADHGYLVIAPNHRDSSVVSHARLTDGLQEFAQPALWTESSHEDRKQDIQKLLHALERDPTWSRSIDWSKVAIVGHSLGGYTALGVAGAWPKWTTPEIKAVIALSPFCAPFVMQKTLSGLRVPVMYQGGTRDYGITPTVIKGGAAYDQTPGPAYYVEFNGAGHFAWTDLNRRYQESIDLYCVAFLDRYLKGDRSADLTRRLSDVSDLRSKP